MRLMDTSAGVLLSLLHRDWKKTLSVSLLAFGVLLVASCGGSISSPASGSPPPSVSQGSVVVFAGDAPACDVTSLSMTITGMTLTPASGGSPVSVFPANSPVTPDFASLAGSSMMLGSANVPAGSYSQATVTLSNPEMGMYSSGTGGMGYGMMNSSLSTSSVSVTLSPPLQVPANGTAGMMLDLNLLKSIQTNNGSVTGTVNPTFEGSAISTEGSGIMEELGVLSGIVQGVTTTSSNSNFSGSFTLDQWMMDRTFTVNVTSQTGFHNASGLSNLAAGMFVQVQASVDASGNIVASVVDMEGQTNSQQSTGGFMGVIPSVTRDASGNASQFEMGMSQEFPDMETMMGLFAEPEVMVTAGAPFQIEDPTANFAGLTFDPTTLGPGQLMTVLGQITGSSGSGMMGGGGAGSLTANSVTLQIQPLIGTFEKVMVNAGDDKTGGFALTPCSSVFGVSVSIPVLTSAKTVFNGMTGLNEIPASSQLILTGLLFWEPNLTNANGVQLTPPGWVFEATRLSASQ